MSFGVASFHHGRNDYDIRDHLSKNAHIVYSFFPPDFVRFQRRDVCIWGGVARHSHPCPVLKKCREPLTQNWYVISVALNVIKANPVSAFKETPHTNIVPLWDQI